MSEQLIHRVIDDYQLRQAAQGGSSALVALVRLRAVLREDRRRTRPYALWERMKEMVGRGVEIPKHPMGPMAYVKSSPRTVRGDIVRGLADPMRMVP